MFDKCPFCKNDPYEYVDVGVGRVPIAVNCCTLGMALYYAEPGDPIREAFNEKISKDELDAIIDRELKTHGYTKVEE